MRHIVFILLFSAFITSSYTQSINNDTLTCKSTVKSPWGMKFEVGGLFHVMPQQNIVNNKFVLVGSFSVFYKKLFFRNEVYTFTFSSNDFMEIDGYVFSTEAEFISINLNSEIGYSFYLGNNWSSDIRLGANFTNFDLSNSEELGSFSSDFVTGAIFGITLNRYFEFHRFKYLILGINIDYYSTNYSAISPDLNKSSLNFSLTAAYKLWFHKSMD